MTNDPDAIYTRFRDDFQKRLDRNAPAMTTDPRALPVADVLVDFYSNYRKTPSHLTDYTIAVKVLAAADAAVPVRAGWQPIATLPAEGSFLVALYAPTNWAYHVGHITLRDGDPTRLREIRLKYAEFWMHAPPDPRRMMETGHE